MTAQEAAAKVAAYRTRHVIDPVGERYAERCGTCGVKVYPIRRGWRHDMSEVAGLDRASWGILYTMR